MSYEAQLNFFRKIIHDLNIASCVVEDPQNHIPPQIDLGLRRDLFGTENYVKFLENDMMQANRKTIYCFFDEYDCKYIFFQLPGTPVPSFFFIGPYLLQMPTRQWLQHRRKSMGLNETQQQQMELYYTGLPILEDENWLLSMTRTLISAIDPESSGYEMDYIQYQIPDRHTPIPFTAIRGSDSELNLSILEQNYQSEKLLMDAVSQGKLHLLTSPATTYHSGAQARLTDSLRNRKNYLIILKTLLRKAAEYGGVHPLYLHRISSRYADEIESIRTVKQSLRLQEEMIRNYCLLVRHHSLSKYSYYVGQVITMVQFDLTADLHLKTIAGKLNVNASYLSDLFHREYGCTLTEFVNRERIGHAILLLKTSPKNVQEIALESGFQEVNYFIKLFKRQTGFTPNQYREQLGNVSLMQSKKAD